MRVLQEHGHQRLTTVQREHLQRYLHQPQQCAANDTMEITINPAPFIEADATDSLICEGDSNCIYRIYVVGRYFYDDIWKCF